MILWRRESTTPLSNFNFNNLAEESPDNLNGVRITNLK